MQLSSLMPGVLPLKTSPLHLHELSGWGLTGRENCVGGNWHAFAQVFLFCLSCLLTSCQQYAHHYDIIQRKGIFCWRNLSIPQTQCSYSVLMVSWKLHLWLVEIDVSPVFITEVLITHPVTAIVWLTRKWFFHWPGLKIKDICAPLSWGRCSKEKRSSQRVVLCKWCYRVDTAPNPH